MLAMTFACTPDQGPNPHIGATSGTKRRRPSRRGERLCAETPLSTLCSAAGEPQCRRQRLVPPSSPHLQSKPPATLDCPALTAAAEEAARRAEESYLLRNLKTIVINMERRPDRLEGCKARLATTCPDLQIQRFPAVDGRQTSIGANMVTSSWDTTENVVYQRIRSIRKGWDDLHTYHERVLQLSPGERGCAASHIQAWRHCLASGVDQPLLVLEDDAAPMPDFAAILGRALAALPSDAGVLYLGYSQAAHWRREISAELVESEYVWTTVGYIIWPAAARFLLSKLPVNAPVDNWMGLLCGRGELKAYCVRPKLIRQSDAWNCGSDILHSDENYWGPDSDIIHSEVAPVLTTQPLERAIPGAIIDDGSSFWDLSGGQQEQVY